MDENEYYEESDHDGQRYSSRESIDPMGISSSLRGLYILDNDMFMRMQAFNLNVVDTFLTDLEYRTLHQLHAMERTPPEAHFLGAQSQMWIFAAYELLRTWQERCKNIVKWAENGGLSQKIEALKAKDDGAMHYGRENQIQQLSSVLADQSLVDRIRRELLHLHIPFTRLEFIRVAIAKHEVSGKAKSVSLMPGYGRINSYCGSLDYQLDNGPVILGMINRRDIADSIRALNCNSEPPSDADCKSFDDFMSGKLPPRSV